MPKFNLIHLILGGGPTSTRTLDLIRDEFIVTADGSKPLVHIWPINSPEKCQTSFVAPGKISALSASPDGNYLALATGNSIFIRQIATSKMIDVTQRHYQTVTVLQFTDDGAHFVSAGHDGYVYVWKLSTLLLRQSEDAAPVYDNDEFSHHALPVTDIYVGHGGMRAIVASVSLDRTCKIRDLASGTLLMNLIFQEALTSIAVDHLESNVYVGTSEGNVFEFSLQSPPRMKEYHVDDDTLSNKQRFVGHSGAVTSLSISLDGATMLTGAADSSVKLWHIPSKQLIRTIPHKGAITNVKFIITPKVMFDQEIKLNLIANKQKQSDVNAIEIMLSQSVDCNDNAEKLISDASSAVRPMKSGKVYNSKSNIKTNGLASDRETEVDALRTEVNRLKQINKELFEQSMSRVLNGK